VKVIIEAFLLTDEQKEIACKLSEQAGAEYVKTSTGFAGGGATLHDIAIMKKSVSSHIKIKASGGIKNYEQAMAFINAGCHRIGTSSLINIVE
jgi:deoxyribose-phosphate aldolase